MKRFIKAIISLVVIIAVTIACGVFYLTRGINTGKNLVINSVSVSNLNDGVYNGIYNGGRWTNKVNVTVKNHRIADIKVVKDVTFPIKNVTDEIINRVIESQNTNVDTIAGSTVTCKAYLKSIETALSNDK